jgi:hypothetical protein
LFLASAAGQGIFFRAGGGTTDNVSITSGGNVLIGTDADTGLYKLDVNGTGRFSGAVTAGGSGNAGLNLRQNTAIDRFKFFVGSGSPYIADDSYISSNNADIHFLAGGSGTTEIVTFKLGGNVGIGTTDQFGGGVKVIGIANATTIPSSNPSGGGVLYVENGALKYRGSSGTVTTIANA